MNADLIAIVMGGVVLVAVICVEVFRRSPPWFVREHWAYVRAQRRAKAQRDAARASSETPT